MPTRSDLWHAPPRPNAVELLERSIAYCSATLHQVTVQDLERSTPCAGWTLGELLRHLDDSLSALGEAAQGGAVALSRAPRQVPDLELVDSICERARGLLGHWLVPLDHHADLGHHELSLEVLAAVGALEITVHGWDVAEALCSPRPIPAALARYLWPVALEHIAAADRPGRFGPVRPVAPDVGPAELLLAQVGRTLR